MSVKRMRFHFALCLSSLLLTGCDAQWVSPYNADLQKKATDMIADVSS
jgi:hypothetical protein